MRFFDITGNDVTTLTEAPMGFMSTVKTGLQSMNPFSLSGRAQAQGKLVAGLDANKMYKSYYQYLGSQGKQQPDTDSLLAFLQQMGYDNRAIQVAKQTVPGKFTASPAPTTPTQTTANPAQPAANQGQALDLDQLKRDKAAKQAAGQAGQQQAMQQMQQTQQANAASSKADNELVSAVKAAKAKPGFQQTAQDKLTIQKGAAKGIHESKKRRLRENQQLDKNELSAIFNAISKMGPPVADSRKTATDTTGGAPAGTSNPADNSAVSSTGQLPSKPNSTSSAPQMAGAKMTVNQLISAYSAMSVGERARFKSSIEQIDNTRN
jgi:hypothetical protein